MTAATTGPRYASPVDLETYGPYGLKEGFAGGKNFQRPRYPFQGRITADGSSGYRAEAGRYHLYIAPGCPWAQRTAIVRTLKGLDDVVTLSVVDDDRDGRGWAFRERRGADPVNGFQFLREAYEATEPGYPGHISVPVLWDRETSTIVSNNFPDITIDLNAAFGAWADNSIDLYPEGMRAEIDELNDYVYHNVNNGMYLVAGALDQEQYRRLRGNVDSAFTRLNERLADRRYLMGDRITEADVRLWVTVARFDVSYNILFRVSERNIVDYPNLWAWARDLYTVSAFRDTTLIDLTGPVTMDPKNMTFLNQGSWRITPRRLHPDWSEPHGRDALSR